MIIKTLLTNMNDEYENYDAIENVIAYIYRQRLKRSLPLYCYGTYSFPPTYNSNSRIS